MIESRPDQDAMIDYFKGMYGVNLLPRVHGSSLYKGSLAGLVSVLVYLAIALGCESCLRGWDDLGEVERELGHPYAAGVLVSSVSFVIIFRANYGYQRYWEACSAVNAMMSKFMDGTQHTAVFYLQNKFYEKVRPPSFFDHDDLNKLNLTRNRKRLPGKPNERRLCSVYDLVKERGDSVIQQASEPPSNRFTALYRTTSATSASSLPQEPFQSPSRFTDLFRTISSPGMVDAARSSEASPGRGTGLFRRRPLTPLPSVLGVDGRWENVPPTPEKASSDVLRRAALNSKYFPATQCPNKNFAVRTRGRTPPLFLQELAHLSSLASAVALSTLRNDVEYSESPLDLYVPGSAWPPADADKLPKDVRVEFQSAFRPLTILRHWMGRDRLPQWRSKYNASRPLHVLGGVSDAEIRFLQMAKGPHAKAQLAESWLLEIMIREHLEGGLGEVHSAIISRLVQFFSDAMLYYNVARMIMYVPFPFPHAQLSAFYTVLMVVVVPFLLDQYTNGLWMGSLVSFLTVTCLVGLHEVARELENPFRNVPNELPLCTLQAMYNEALVTMFSGYNPDSFWDAEAYQGALEAIAQAGVYRKQREGRGGAAEKMTTIEESGGVATATAKAAENGKAAKETGAAAKHVTFSDKAAGGGEELARRLIDTMARQAREIEELERALDEQERSGGEQKSSVKQEDAGAASIPPRIGRQTARIPGGQRRRSKSH